MEDIKFCESKPKREWKCKSCSEIFRTRRLLFQHRKDCNDICDASQRQLNTKDVYCCKFCGKEWTTTKSGFTFHKNYCKENSNRKIIKGHRHTEETKKLLSWSRKKFLQEHPNEHPWKKSSKFKSKPCEDLKQWLRENNIDFEEEVCVVPGKNYSVDIAFPKAMLILEINGNQHYDLNKMELLPYYQKRHDEIEALGWEVLEVPYNQSYSEEFRMGLCRQLDAKLSSKQSFYAGSSPANPLPYLKTLAELKKDRLLKKQQQVLEKAEQVRMEKERKRNDLLKRKELILNCGVDLTRFGWVGEVEKATGLTKRVIENTVKYFDLEVFKRKSRNVHSEVNKLVK